MKRIFSLLLPIALILTLIGCQGGRSGGGAIEFTDMTGHTTMLAQRVERVVALTPSDCEILYALGAGDLVVGRGEYCDYPGEVLELPVLQSGANTNLEQIIALKPQAVFLSTMAQTVEQVKAMEGAGIAMVASNCLDIEDVYTSIQIIGSAVDRNGEAEALIEEMRAGFAAIQNSGPEAVEKPTVYFEVSPLEYGLWTAGSGTFMDEIAAMLGLTNAFADVTGWGEISQEQVIDRNPDYIVSITMYFGEGTRPEEEIAARIGWENIRAVQEGQVYFIDSDAISRPGPRLLEAAETLNGLING